MIYLITGVPGSGKTLLAVEWIRQYLEEGRAVYSDIAGIDMSKVASGAVAGESPRDWRTTPEGSVVVFDEAQGQFASAGKPGRPNDEVILAMETHRHTGHDLIFITQNGTMIHHHIRKLIGRHVHVQRAFGANAANLFQWYEATDERDRGERAKADKQLWRYPKKLFNAYKSATVHTHKVRIPRKLLLLGVVIAVLVGIVGYAWSQVGFVSVNEAPTADAGALEGPSTGALDNGGGLERANGEQRDGGSATGRMTVRDSKVRGTDHLGGDLPETMDDSELNHHWRLVGVVDSMETDNGQYLIKGDGRTVSVPNESMGWVVRSYDKGVLRVSAPGGTLRITWHTGPRTPKEKDAEPPAAVAPREPAGEDSEKVEPARKVIPESSDWSTGSVASWDD